MTDKNKKGNKKGMSPMTAGAIGAAVGAAAVGIAGAAILASKSGRKKVEKVFDETKDKAMVAKEKVEKKVKDVVKAIS